MTPLKKILLAVFCAAMLTIVRAAPVNFDVPAQLAATAVVAFAKQAAVEVLFSSRDLKKVQSTAVVGAYEPQAALELLLSGTEFAATRDAAGKFIVERKRAQPEVGEIRGSVISRSDSRPIADATVRLADKSAVVQTDANGIFVLRDVPVATPLLVIQAEGYRMIRVSEIAVRAGRRVELNPVRLSPLAADDGVQQMDATTVNAGELAGIFTLGQVNVTPSRFGIAEERIAPSVSLTKAELEKLPQIGEDLYRTITRLPGLAADDHSAAFWVRGAPNEQLLARFDGVDLIEPFHLKDEDAALSIIDVATVGSVDLVTGGFTTDYGDRLAGVMTTETQADVSTRRTTLSLSITNLRATSQGGFADGDGQWLVAARRGYIDLAIKLTGNDNTATTTYYDFSGKVEYQLNPHHTVSLHLLYAGDSNTLVKADDGDPDIRDRFASAYIWGRWRGTFGERLIGESVLAFSRLDWNRNANGFLDGGVHPFTLSDKRRLDTVSLRQDWTYNLTERALLRSGFEFKFGEASYDYNRLRALYVIRNGDLLNVTRTSNLSLRPKGDYDAGYFATRFQPWNPLVIEPGVRFEHHTSTGDSAWSPRVNASVVFGRTTLRAAWGIYEQAQGLHELSVQDGEKTFHAPEWAEQRVLGLSHKLDSGLSLRAEVYERLSSHLRPHWENPSDPYESFPESVDGRIQLSPTRGRARGVELIAEHRGSGRFGWGVSYAYAISEEEIAGRWIPRTRDQRHTFYSDVTYAPSRNWQLSASWQFHTGWPTTAVNYSLVPLNNGSLSYTWLYGPINAERAPAYHRLDLRATRTYRLKRGTLRFFMDVFNAYDASNEYGLEDHYARIDAQGKLIVTKVPAKMLPILPSLGISWEF
jgi:TonB dependent receptor/Carboxypeptidase regulatory-like domain/TonB-dependent Receptor Plug Domain